MLKKRKKENPIRKTTGPGGNYRKTKDGAGMTAKGVRAHRAANPGSKLKTAVTGKVKRGSKVRLLLRRLNNQLKQLKKEGSNYAYS